VGYCWSLENYGEYALFLSWDLDLSYIDLSGTRVGGVVLSEYSIDFKKWE
jgi:hypothetical protein